MATPITVQLLVPPRLQIAPTAPCVLEVDIPILLPHQLDPSLPAPPYHNRPGGLHPELFRELYATPLAQRLAADIISALFGPNPPGGGAVLVFPDGGTAADHARFHPGPYNFALVPAWECNAVTEDRESGAFDPVRGYWRDMHGKEGHGPIHAFTEALDFDWTQVYHAFKYFLVRWPGAPTGLLKGNPRVLRLEVVEGGGEREVVFEVKEYTEVARRNVNGEVAAAME
ncbi:hypothetical protein C8A05DRAFT_33470 [Staphylotrichum tortipilum]|uniref:Uncharacterized protein n=1 Tax=Staphylotrichum tortipilum TaxID=2831512 RepID=A0AAN6MLH6_9PEZI|nr:hypothetical protein C8A05DRAFT_33470 [Staphylotrichum longicolle]